MGAARFLRGLHSLIEPAQLTVIGNTGDDETFFGLHVSPDIDTVIYTLAGVVHPGQGWGVAGDTFRCLEHLQRHYDETWFRLGDADLATHLYRTDALRRGIPLHAVTARLARHHGLRTRVLPMSDDPVRTVIHVRGRGPLPFQAYLVRGRGRGRVERVQLVGARRARPAPGVLDALRDARGIIVPPSNPLVSIGPILAVRGVRAALRRRTAPAVAVSPLVGGRPVKGPLDRMLRGLGHAPTAAGVARLYRGLIDTFVLDRADADQAPAVAALGMRPVVTDTIMRTPARARRLAAAVLAALEQS